MRTIEEPPAKCRIPMRRTFCTLFRTAAAGVLALLLAAAAPDPALADECVYNDGSSDLGPCMQFENGMPLSTGTSTCTASGTQKDRHAFTCTRTVTLSAAVTILTTRGSELPLRNWQHAKE